MIDLSAYDASILKILDDLGSPCKYTRVKDNVSINIVAGFKTAGPRDEAITNSYGVNAKIITVNAADFTIAPIKYDEFKFDGNNETYVAEASHPIHSGAKVLLYKIYIKGK